MALALVPALAAAALLSGGVEVAGLAVRGERSPEWLAWGIAVALVSMAVAAAVLAWGILFARPWAAQWIRELAEADNSIVVGVLLQALLGSERTRRWFDA